MVFDIISLVPLPLHKHRNIVDILLVLGMRFQYFFFLCQADGYIFVDEHRSEYDGDESGPVDEPSEHYEYESEILGMPGVSVYSRSHHLASFAVPVEGDPSGDYKDSAYGYEDGGVDHRYFHAESDSEESECQSVFCTFYRRCYIFRHEVNGERKAVHFDKERNEKAGDESVLAPMCLSPERQGEEQEKKENNIQNHDMPFSGYDTGLPGEIALELFHEFCMKQAYRDHDENRDRYSDKILRFHVLKGVIEYRSS